VLTRETLPLLHNLVYRRSLRRILVPTLLEELPHLGGETDLLSVLRQRGPTSFNYPSRSSRVTLPFERALASEHLDDQHRQSENVGIFGLHDHNGRVMSWFNDLWSEPPHVSTSGFSCGEVDAKVDGGKPVIRQPNAPERIDENVRLRDQNR